LQACCRRCFSFFIPPLAYNVGYDDMTRVREISSVIGTLLGAGVLLVADSAVAASFDCARAKAADEKAVCANRSLNDLDVTMGEHQEQSRKMSDE
jgi:hypothetical protein